MDAVIGWTKDLQLRKMKLRQFSSDRRAWGSAITRLSTDHLHLRMENPIAINRHTTLIEFCKTSPYFSGISVHHSPEGWYRASADSLVEEEIRKVAELANQNPKQVDYLEAHFYYDQKIPTGERATIEFAKHPSGLIVGYMIRFLRTDEHLFRCPPSSAGKRYAVADPNRPDLFQIIGQ